MIAIKKFHSVAFLFLIVFFFLRAEGQDKKTAPAGAVGSGDHPGSAQPTPKTNPKPYKEIITDKAKSSTGLITVHKVEDKWYFEIPDSIFGREILAVTRIAKTATGAGYGGEEVNEQVLRFVKGPENKVFIRVVFYINVASDSLPINQAVRNSNVEPIAASFDIKAFGKDSSGAVIEVTDFFKGDNQVVSLPANYKRIFNLSAPATDRSYINSIKTFPINTEIRVTRTYSASAPMGIAMSPFPSIPLVAAAEAGAVTLEINTSMVLLPKEPYKRRFFDERVGYFSDGYTNYGLDVQKSQNETFITRWKLEPKAEDVEKMKRGELVEPQKPIVFYIDPATPVKWRKFLKLGVEDWQGAFEKAGFKNAIIAKDWPENDSTMSLEDARFSVIRYFASDIENAYGPQVHDPRSGEILESHIGWYHNVMNLLHDWYLIQTAAVDPRARKVKFDDSLMGDLVRFVSSHEVGHTLGLQHNMGSSSATPVEKLRDKAWVEANGHTSSIMDYARFNYVAQPEDHIGPAGLYPRIGDYDKWAIEWGYKIIPGATEKQEKDTLNSWVKAHISNPRYRFLRQRFISTDPRAQTEDLGDNAMKAGEYGIKNLKRILPNLNDWTFEAGEPYQNLDEVYEQVIIQLRRYMGHAAANIGGIYEDPKTYDQQGEVFAPVPKSIQKDAVAFLNKNAFETPDWLLDWKQLKKFNQDQVVEEIRSFQQLTLNLVLDPGRMERILESSAEIGKEAYALDDLFDDLRKGIWSEIYSHKPIDIYRRNLQKAFVENLGNIINGQSGGIRITGISGRLASYYGITAVNVRISDIISVSKGTLRTLKTDITAALPSVQDRITKYHLQDVLDRINLILNPKGN
jgi:hypothetical protein